MIYSLEFLFLDLIACHFSLVFLLQNRQNWIIQIPPQLLSSARVTFLFWKFPFLKDFSPPSSPIAPFPRLSPLVFVSGVLLFQKKMKKHVFLFFCFFFHLLDLTATHTLQILSPNPQTTSTYHLIM